MRKKLLAAAVIAALAVSLTGCYTADSPGKGDRWYADTVTLPDGTRVMCVAAGAGGVTCDWDGRKR